MRHRISIAIASMLRIGFIPGAPGTYASIATTLIFLLFYSISHRIVPALHLSAVCLINDSEAGDVQSGEFRTIRITRVLNHDFLGKIVR